MNETTNLVAFDRRDPGRPTVHRVEPDEDDEEEVSAEDLLASILQRIASWPGDYIDHPDHIGEENPREIAEKCLEILGL
jgi:hypothetical protein